ncbi:MULTISPECIES: sensor histidine kinase [Cyanophyceae]|uniref:sensor histidine kinase n=1 Tax=Cyanophyceae TaxID=3028117 RepID=UPI0016885933|nr:sensor histidine kinase [Trichocoleus sp. FACHB-69]MBD1934194.1 sensor histidine kinase [Trichocoleus sp. FACHB-69]
MDFSQLLIDKSQTITDKWIEAVRSDRQIQSADDLSRTAIQNHLPDVLRAMATVLAKYQESDINTLVEASLEHGVLRAGQGFEPIEIAREYRLLRQVTFSTLEEDLKQASSIDVMRAVRLIDAVVDEAIAQCFKSYMEQRLGELQQLQSQLQLNNQELTRLVRANQESLSHLAHELKTPLTSIIGYSELFLRQQRNKDQVNDNLRNLEHIDKVLWGGRQLLRLINDTLEISRYEAGKMKLQPSSTNVRSLINSVIEMVQPLANSKQLQMIVECDWATADSSATLREGLRPRPAPERVFTDPLRLQQIITNLLSNAIRYTEAGSIKLTCQTVSPEEWAIAIADTGIGIEPEDQIRIFEPYFQAGSSQQSYHPHSTGLGLAIVSRLVKLLQGKMELVSEIGIGSTFTVIFPLEVQI